MTIKNLFMLGGVLAGAAYLRDKGRRDRLMGQARGLIDKAKGRATELAGKVESKASDSAVTGRHDNGVSASNYEGYDAGIGSTRTYR